MLKVCMQPGICRELSKKDNDNQINLQAWITKVFYYVIKKICYITGNNKRRLCLLINYRYMSLIMIAKQTLEVANYKHNLLIFALIANFMKRQSVVETC